MTNQMGKRAVDDDLRHTAAVAANYNQLQGLITATTGVGLIVWACGSLTWGAIIAALGVAVWTTYYVNRFGKAAGKGSLLTSTVLIVAAILGCAVGFVVDGLTGWPVLLLPLIAVVCLVVSFTVSYRNVGVTWAHWGAAGLLGASAFAPAVGLAMLGASTGVFVLGVSMVVIGLVDHARLVAAMKPVPLD